MKKTALFLITCMLALVACCQNNSIETLRVETIRALPSYADGDDNVNILDVVGSTLTINDSTLAQIIKRRLELDDNASTIMYVDASGELSFFAINGTMNQVLQTDGSGNISWGTVTGGGGSFDLGYTNGSTDGTVTITGGGTSSTIPAVGSSNAGLVPELSAFPDGYVLTKQGAVAVWAENPALLAGEGITLNSGNIDLGGAISSNTTLTVADLIQFVVEGVNPATNINVSSDGTITNYNPHYVVKAEFNGNGQQEFISVQGTNNSTSGAVILGDESLSDKVILGVGSTGDVGLLFDPINASTTPGIRYTEDISSSSGVTNLTVMPKSYIDAQAIQSVGLADQVNVPDGSGGWVVSPVTINDDTPSAPIVEVTGDGTFTSTGSSDFTANNGVSVVNNTTGEILISNSVSGQNVQVETNGGNLAVNTDIDVQTGHVLGFNDNPSVTVDVIRDEDDLVSDDENALATQQSIKAYIDNAALGGASGIDDVLAVGQTLTANRTIDAATFNYEVDRTASIDGDFTLAMQNSASFLQYTASNSDIARVQVVRSGTTAQLLAEDASAGDALSFNVSPAGMTANDPVNNLGIYYGGNYATGATDRWLTDKGYVDGAIAAGGGSSAGALGKFNYSNGSGGWTESNVEELISGLDKGLQIETFTGEFGRVYWDDSEEQMKFGYFDGTNERSYISSIGDALIFASGTSQATRLIINNGDATELVSPGGGDFNFGTDLFRIEALAIESLSNNSNLVLRGEGSGNTALGTMVFEDDQVIGSSQDNHVLTYDNASGSISLEAPVLQMVQLQLTASQLINSNTSPIEIIPAQGANTLIFVKSLFYNVKRTVDFDGTGFFGLYYDNTGTTLISNIDLINRSGTFGGLGGLGGLGGSNLEGTSYNQPVYFYGANDSTVGDGIMDLIVYYTVIENLN